MLVMRKLFLIAGWVVSTFLTILVSLYLTAYPNLFSSNQYTPSSNVVYATSVLGAFQSRIISGDARPEIIERFLKQYNCPLKPYDHYALTFVEVADAYNLDFRLLPAIAMQESNCCRKIPEGSNNCWGYGIYGEKVLRFSSIEDGMKAVAAGLGKYHNKGLLEPVEIMQKYTPQSQGSWALNVTRFMEMMQ